MIKTDRFFSHVEKTDTCWKWTGRRVNGNGPYGTYSSGSLAHRVSYMFHRGPIAAGMEIDHTCRNTLCVNPDHLEPVTRAENIRRRMQAKPRCNRGHEYTGEGRPDGHGRLCRICDRQRAREQYARILAAKSC